MTNYIRTTFDDEIDALRAERDALKETHKRDVAVISQRLKSLNSQRWKALHDQDDSKFIPGTRSSAKTVVAAPPTNHAPREDLSLYAGVYHTPDNACWSTDCRVALDNCHKWTDNTLAGWVTVWKMRKAALEVIPKHEWKDEHKKWAAHLDEYPEAILVPPSVYMPPTEQPSVAVAPSHHSDDYPPMDNSHLSPEELARLEEEFDPFEGIEEGIN